MPMKFKLDGQSGICDERCQEATEKICTCSCGGDNHGVANDSPDPMVQAARKARRDEMVKRVVEMGGSVQPGLFELNKEQRMKVVNGRMRFRKS